MRINKVTASAFGPLLDQELTLASGMTVIVGDNESAKSSWHAAVYAALCGRRRGKGAPLKDEQRFADLHRPWDDERWLVFANITLDDGRTVQMYQDLAGKIDCRALDVGMGAVDISSEVMFEGCPDASRWLGLDRHSFAATATVNQAELLKILTDADGLQEALQRAAATAGATDATAAAALTRLAAFSRDHVGLDRSNSTKPLRVAKDGLAATDAALVAARLAHEQYLELVTGADDAHRRAHECGQRVDLLGAQVSALDMLSSTSSAATAATADVARCRQRAAELATDVGEATDRLARARVLDAQFGGQAPAGTLADDDTATLVIAALADFRAIPEPAVLTGPSSADLAAELAALPTAPTGDTTVASQVRGAAAAFTQAVALLGAHAQDRPEPAPELDSGQVAASAAGQDLLRELAGELAAPTPALDPALTRAVSTAQIEADQASAEPAAGAEAGTGTPAGRATTALAASAALVALAVVAFVLGAAALGGAALALGLLAAAAGIALRAKAGASAASLTAASSAAASERLMGARTTLAGAQARLDAQQSVVDAAVAARKETAQRCELLGLAASPLELKAAAAGVEHRAAGEATRRVWEQRQTALVGGHDQSARLLTGALDARGAAVGPDPLARCEQYERDCATRVELSAAAGRAGALTREHEQRVAAEHAAEQAAGRRASALASLRRAAAVVAAPESEAAEAPELVGALAGWQTQRLAGLAAAEAAQRDWAQLGALLSGKTLDQLDESVAVLAATLAGAQADLDTAVLTRADAVSARTAQLDAAPAEVKAAAVAGVSDEDVEVVAEAGLAAAKGALAEARTGATSAVAVAADADGSLRERARMLPSVAEAEERAQDAAGELDRVLELDTTLTLTRDFLDAAQQRVHRDIAPVLTATLTAWLPRITGGRYVEAAVDPRTLQVKVCGPGRNWRSADLLSHGTAEQVYLLLRVALARHLTTAGVTCPLLLDDVTVQADSKRTTAILDLLHELSQDQQIIVFGQQQEVADWARQKLTGPSDSLVEMPQVLCS